MKNKKIGIAIAIISILTLLMGYIISYANTDETIYVNLQKADTNGIGYGIGNPKNGGNSGGVATVNAYIWNITTYDKNDKNSISKNQRNLYCLKANYGNTWENVDTNQIVAYNLSYDLQKDREEILKKIVSDKNTDADEVVKTILNAESGYYKEILWILDNIYISGQTDKEEFLNKIGIKYNPESEEYEGEPTYKYQPNSEYNYSNIIDSGEYYYTITDEDIKAVQKASIWYYTNYAIDNKQTVFNKKGSKNWLNITDDGGNTYEALDTYRPQNTLSTEGADRNEQAVILYNYLIDAAKNYANKYTENNNYTIEQGIKINTEGLTQNTNGKYKLTTTRIDSNYVIGPIKIENNNSSAYGISIEVTNQNGKTVDYTFTDANGKTLNTTDVKELVGKTEGFYISIARNEIEKINIKLKVEQETTKKTLWLKGTETTNEIKLEGEQPIVEVTRTNETITTEFETQPEEFDLALRKYITQLNGTKLTNTRVPNIDETTLQTGTTATYKHRKDPVVVQDGDEVTYTLAIYNEGNKNGYASQIIDQLPTGLISSPKNSATVISKDKNGKEKNKYTLSYNTTSNKITLTIINSTENPAKELNSYAKGNLDYETIEIKCKVAQEPDTKEQITLTNVAWIAKAYDTEAGVEILTKGQDRDSEPKTSPDVNKGNMENYKGNTSNKNDLADSSYYYQGEQDDDDFEKLIINPVKKKFDLELVKFISAVSKDAKIDDGEYLTDTKNADGKYDRAPKVSIVKEQDSEDRRIHCDWSPSNKNPLLVEAGDYVLYTIRVYNAGEIDGYASEIKDHLPVGLEFVETTDTTAEYYGIWNIENVTDANGDEKQIVSTTYLAKGQGKELDTAVGDENYTANLLKALKPDEEVVDGENRNPDYRDVQVLCRVKENTQSNTVLVNYAQISQDTDKDGKDIDDDDSTPGNLPESGPHEDDEDLEKIKIRTSGKYNLTLIKEDENGEQLNSTATFEITKNGEKEEKTVTGRLTIAENIPVDAEHLEDDIYIIKELKAPDEYCKFDGIITITVSKKLSSDGTRYEYSMKYTVTDTKENDITNETKNVDVYLNENGNIYVEVKNYKEPEIHKGVKEIENQDSGYNADETHKWVIQSGIPGNVEDYKYYAITDEIDYRLKFEGIDKVIVKAGNTKLTQGTDYQIKFEENNTGVQNKTISGKLTITLIDTENSVEASSKMKKNIGKNIEVTFETTFAKDENGKLLAEMGTQIPNQAKLEYKNTSSDETIIKESEKPEVHTGGVILYKYYNSNNQKVSLEGAKFGIYKTEEDAKNNKNVIMTATSDEKGIVKFIGLEYGGDAKDDKNNLTSEGTYKYDADKASTQYWIAEIEAPEGYKKSDKIIEVIIDKDSYNEEQIKYEVENIKLNFDLALRKFITKVQENDITTREPQIKIENGKVTYEHTKEPLIVHVGDTVIYTIRVYNEGDIEGYANLITDDIPEYLEYLPENTTNVEYMWKMYDENNNETEEVEKAVKVKTTYLSRENNKDNLLNAFDGATLDFKDIKIAFKVKDPTSNTYIITNHAQISDDTDKDGNEIKDIDSEPDEWNEGEDDQDIENIKVEYFDLALLKFVSKVIVIEDGKETITETGYNGYEDPEPVVKVELHKKKINNVVVKFGYGITIINEGDIAGYATEITDYIPEGLKFDPTDNPEWTDEGNNVISTRQLEGTLLQPGESATVEVILTWINGPENLALKTNTAEISEDKNEYDVPDRDSTPDNKVEGEDDIDIAKVILAITTGTAKTYFTLTLGLLVVIATGVFLIKKYVI